MRARPVVYGVAAVVSGAVWSGLAMLFESMAPNTVPASALLACGILTGLAVSYVFRGAFRRARAPWKFLLPLATVPFAVSLFAVLVWFARRALGHPFSSQAMLPGEELSLVLTGYLVYGLLSMFTPVIYALSLVNQGIMHFILARGVEQ
jgi:hypothetical protein